MTKLSQPGNSLPRPSYTFEELEAAVELAPTLPLDEVTADFEQVGKMMIDGASDYHIFVSKAGLFVTSVVRRELG